MDGRIHFKPVVDTGDVLMKSIKNIGGRILLVAGSEITEANKKRLHVMGGYSGYIDGNLDVGDICFNIYAELSKACKLYAEEVLNHILKHKPEIMQCLYYLKDYHEGTYRHCLRTGEITLKIAIAKKLDKDYLIKLVIAALLHDTGKLTICKSILEKPGKLDDAEFGIIKSHPVSGADIINSLVEPDALIVKLVKSHHEDLVGSGYPNGIVVTNPLTQILTTADCYAALTERRSYRPAMSHREAIGILKSPKYNQDLVKSL